MRYVPNLPNPNALIPASIEDDTCCQPCQEEGLEPHRVTALIDGVPMCHDCACVELDI